ncbi:MAG TPA: hypothetical protein VEY06_05090 [Flavisolibacter sp.]|nr:hypothetical protein [Flavisolibacter sp.]
MATNKTTTQKTASGAVPKKELKKRSAVQPPAPAVKSETLQKKAPPTVMERKGVESESFNNAVREKDEPVANNSEKAEAENKNDHAKNSVNMNGIGDLIGNASNIVLKAASILEVEIARGILAAQQVEEKYSNLPKIRSGEIISNRQFDDLFVRFRKDAHDILDLIVDFTAIAAQSASRVTNHFIKIGGTKPSTTHHSQQVPLIQVPGELKAGEQISFPVTLENDNVNEAKTILFVNSPLTDSSGNQLNTSSVTFSPNPLTIQPSSTGNVTVILKIPADAKPGNYNCFVQAQNTESLKATLMVKVV